MERLAALNPIFGKLKTFASIPHDNSLVLDLSRMDFAMAWILFHTTCFSLCLDYIEYSRGSHSPFGKMRSVKKWVRNGGPNRVSMPFNSIITASCSTDGVACR